MFLFSGDFLLLGFPVAGGRAGREPSSSSFPCTSLFGVAQEKTPMRVSFPSSTEDSGLPVHTGAASRYHTQEITLHLDARFGRGHEPFRFLPCSLEKIRYVLRMMSMPSPSWRKDMMAAPNFSGSTTQGRGWAGPLR